MNDGSDGVHGDFGGRAKELIPARLCQAQNLSQSSDINIKSR